ncbi:MAG: hypothetical protein MMC23_007791, partial [Stictis urceolatum]|nr:hypothetical protein [Stictis urceolata]
CHNCTKRNLDCSFASGDGSIIFLPGLRRKNSPNPHTQGLSPVSASSSSRISGSSKESASDKRNREYSFDDGGLSVATAPSAENAPYFEMGYSSLSPSSMGLFNHFNAHTWKTLCGEETVQKRASLWLQHVGGLAQHQCFVFHGVLAVTALHLALEESGNASNHQAMALHHHTTAIRSSQPYMQSLQQKMVPSLFVFSMLMATYAFGYPKASGYSLQPIHDAHEILKLLRGTSTIAQNGEAAIEDGPFTGLRLPRLQNPDVPLPAAVESALNALSTHNEQYTRDETMKKSYREAVGSLWFTFLLLQEKPRYQMAVLPFAVLAPMEVLENIGKKEPIALLILAHYAVVLHHLNEHIWQRGWGRWIVEEVSQEVDSDWSQYLEWAEREVGITG